MVGRVDISKVLKLVIDHDAGTNPDDILAFLLLLNVPEVEILMTISGNNHPVERARYAHHFLSLAGRSDIPCYAGEKTGHTAFHGSNLIEKNTYEPPCDYLSALKNRCDQEDRVVYLAIQGLGNLDRFLAKYPDMAKKLCVYHMGITLTGADKGFVTGGTNIESNPVAAKRVYERKNIDLHVVGSHTTINDQLRLTPETPLYQKLAASPHPHYQMAYQALLEFHERRGIWPALHDPLTASAAIGKGFVTFYEEEIDFREDGAYKIGAHTKIIISKNADYKSFLHYFASLL